MEKLKRYLTVSHGLVAAVIIVVAILLFVTVRSLEQNYQSVMYIEQSQLENSIQEIENENMRLKQNYYKSAEYLELAARMTNKAMPGENLVILPETYDDQVNQGVASPPIDNRSNPEKWLEFFLGSHE
jgi:hypothetical protein